MIANARHTEHLESRCPLLLTAKEAAILLSISPRKLWSLTTCHEVPHIRIGRSVRYSLVDLEAWIAERRSTRPVQSANAGHRPRKQPTPSKPK